MKTSFRLHTATRTWGLAALLMASPAFAQQDPACLMGGAGTDGFRQLWGGEMRHVFHRDTAIGRRIWVVGDGGQIRHSAASAPFQLQATPAGATQTLLDVFFLPDGATGWACGVGGRLLTTTNSGQTWSYLNGPPQSPIQSQCGGPAVLWRARFLNAQAGFVCGLRTFRYTAAGGDLASEWLPVELYEDATLQTQLSEAAFEFYGLELLGTAGNWVGVCIGQRWGGHNPCKGSAEPGVVFYTDSANPASAGGRKWWITTRLDGIDPAHQGVAIEDPWDIEFEPNPADIRNAVGYMAGGTGVGNGAIYRTTTSGRSFTLEAGSPGNPVNTMYGVAALTNGRAVACGYGGQIHSRNAATGVWNPEFPGTFTGPLGDVHGIGGDGDDCLVVGSWGFVRVSFNAAAPWTSLNPASASANTELHRLEDVAFRDDLNGVAVGAKQAIIVTTDGGCTWQPKSGDLLNPQVIGAFQGVALGTAGEGVAVGIANLTNPLEAAAKYAINNGASWVPSDLSAANLPDVVDLRDVVRSTGANYWAVGIETLNTGGTRPLILFSYNAGAQFFRVPHSLPNNLVLTGVTFLNATDGFVVGYTTSPDTPKAYLLTYTGSSVNFADVSPVGLPGRLNGVAARGTQVLGGDIYAVGGDYTLGVERGYVLKYTTQVPQGQTPRFQPVSGAQFLKVPYRSVAMAQDGPLVLVGMENRLSEALSEDFGKVLRFNGAGWTTIKAQTNKYVRNIFLRSQTRGWAISRSDAPHNSSEFGSVNDSMVLLYDPF